MTLWRDFGARERVSARRDGGGGDGVRDRVRGRVRESESESESEREREREREICVRFARDLIAFRA